MWRSDESKVHWCRICMNRATKKLIEDIPGHDEMDVLEISGDDWKYSGLFNSVDSLHYPDFDICKTSTVRTYNVIIAEQVLEHVKSPYKALRNMYDSLKPGGYLLITTPFLIQIHDFPVDCTRWTPMGMKWFLEECGFSDVHTDGWGNRACINDSFNTPWSYYKSWEHSLENEPLFPVVVWSLGRKK